MPRVLIEVPRAVLAFLAIALNTIVHATPLLLLALVKAMIPHAGFRRRMSTWLIVLAESWIAVNSALVDGVGTRLVVQVDGALNRRGWYLVLSNHQSWVDIPVLQKIFNRRIPFLKFFLKSELIWVPVLGLAWWALDFPFMKRYSRQQLEARPELRGKDIEATRRACEKYRELPVSVMNFVEGTRFTAAKHADGSPYARLLPPRAGGVAFVLDAMGDMLDAIIDVTLHYPGGKPTIYDLLAGRVREVRAHVRTIPIPDDLRAGSYENDVAFRARFQAWINALWTQKDARLAQLAGAEAAA
ncbi:acyltransferase [Chiayiivirga flava]|uniref:1-acyl-sn-glycerol-3-phosphate acyltransferase n=1 Tax=Chiayiivirga flava TaxID=659595 RepID=A0A7W8D992_9GAMM|nr:acyltransferase [Chiayiivirga flava]MBB5209132.1 1-acyl-sn-glycerol-3-phosphate acyltransferase [Chiayiivirga flava]